jgi:hypothetical protein
VAARSRRDLEPRADVEHGSALGRGATSDPIEARLLVIDECCGRKTAHDRVAGRLHAAEHDVVGVRGQRLDGICDALTVDRMDVQVDTRASVCRDAYWVFRYDVS